jgi:cytochrome c biogenesis protein CcdA/thiol-disulfide isomerase/thioredoxin
VKQGDPCGNGGRNGSSIWSSKHIVSGEIPLILFFLAYLGGVLTILSPCILPVLPFVFARADKPFVRSALPLLAGMALTFALVATLAAVAGGWAVAANRWGRAIAILLLGVFGVTLLFPEVSDRLTRPLVALGARLSQSASDGEHRGASVVPSFLLGVATGLLWAQCAGPVLGLILTGAALQGANTTTTLLLLVYALGAATSLALALLIGGRVFKAMKRSLGVGEWIRRGVGALVLVAVVAIAFGADTGFLTRISLAGTASLEQSLLEKLDPAASHRTDVADSTMAPQAAGATPADLPVEGVAPSLEGAVGWLNSPPLTIAALKGKVVLVDFWTYSCINCLRTLPYVKAWAAKYRDHGLIVIGVHTPEFAFEKDVDNVRSAVARLGVDYPVAIDNNYAVWQAFHNGFWPAHYFIDATGNVRHHHFGEGGYDEAERIIQKLLSEAGNRNLPGGLVAVSADGALAAADQSDNKSPETYLGYGRGTNFVSPGGPAMDLSHVYQAGMPSLNQWGFSGAWTIGKESSVLDQPGGGITYRFHARDVHLVLGPAIDGKPVRFKVTVDGQPPGNGHGADTDADGNGVVTGQRLYQVVRQNGPVADRTFEITFFDPGVHAYTFTFG